jgi:hypothetical protein
VTVLWVSLCCWLLASAAVLHAPTRWQKRKWTHWHYSMHRCRCSTGGGLQGRVPALPARLLRGQRASVAAAAGTAAWLAAAAAAAGLAAGSGKQSAARSGLGGGNLGSGFSGGDSLASGMSRKPSLRSLGLQRFPSMPALSGLLGFGEAPASRDAGFLSGAGGGGGGSQQGYAAAFSFQPSPAEQSYKAAKGNGSHLSGNSSRLPADSIGSTANGFSGGGSTAGGSAASSGGIASGAGVYEPAAALPSTSQTDWGPRMSPPPTPHADAGDGCGADAQQHQFGSGNAGGWGAGRTGAKRRGLR